MAYMFKAYPTFTTEISEEFLDTEETQIKVVDIEDKFIPSATENEPQLLTLVDRDEYKLETIMYTGKDEENNLVTGITRGVEGEVITWPAGTEIGRFHTAEEHDRVVDNIVSVELDLSSHESATSDIHGIGETDIVASESYVDTKADSAESSANSYTDSHESDTSGIHGVGLSDVASKEYADNALSMHESDTSGVHGVGTSTVASQSWTSSNFNNYSLESHGNAYHSTNYADISGDTFTGDVIYASGALIRKVDTGGTTHTIVDNDARVWRAVYNDIAELMLRRDTSEPLEPGDVLIATGDGLSRTGIEKDSRVVGVYSDSYGFCLGGSELESIEMNLDRMVTVGISGRVRVKVKGAVEIGDLLTTSDEKGYAKVIQDDCPGTVFAKALESTEGAYGKVFSLIMMA